MLAPALHANPYYIPKLKADQVLAADSVVVPLGDSLRPLDAGAAREGPVYLRKKFSTTEYGLYECQLRPEAYRRLHLFRVTNPVFAQRLQTKFFLRPLSLPFNDLPVVYFDREFVMVPDLEEIAYSNSGEWIKVLAEAEHPARLWVASEPTGAEVYQNGRKAGQTPLLLSASGAPWEIIKLRRKESFPVQFTLRLEPGALAVRMVSLPAAVIPEEPLAGRVNLRALAQRDTGDVRVFHRRRVLVESRRQAVAAFQGEADARFEARYPEMDPGITDETDSAHQLRRQEWAQDRAGEKEWMAVSFRRSLEEHDRALAALDSLIDDLEYLYRSDTLPGSAITAIRRLGGGEGWEVSVEALDSLFKFKYQGRLAGPEEALERLAGNRAEARVVVRGWDLRWFSEADEQALAALDSLKVVLGGQEFPARGEFSYQRRVVGSERYAAVTARAALFRERAAAQRRLEEEWRRQAEARREREILEARIVARQKLTRVVVAGGLAAAGGGAALLANWNRLQADEDYVKYRAAVNGPDASRHRRRVEAADARSQWYGILGALNVGVSFFLFTF